MTNNYKCPECGKPLSENAPQGLCPGCLMRAAIGTGSAIDSHTNAEAANRARGFIPPSPDELAPRFPELEIISLLGRGGMGAVYKARQTRLDRFVALKILPPGLQQDPSFAERFVREAKALAKLHHPHIVTLFEFGEADGLFFFLMEFVDGVNLRELMHNSRISPREALAIVPQICEALQYAHDRGIVHRDIKPENILLNQQGQVKIADFGVARIMAMHPEHTTDGAPVSGSATDAGQVIGTPQYMAPEQFTRPGEVDHRADIYALGVVFYQMLTGEMPSQKLEPPSRKVHIDVRIDEIVMRALDKNPALRYQQVNDFKTQVETISSSLKQRSQKSDGEPARSEKPLDLTGLWILAGCTFLVLGLVPLLLEREPKGVGWSILGIVFILTGLYVRDRARHGHYQQPDYKPHVEATHSTPRRSAWSIAGVVGIVCLLIFAAPFVLYQLARNRNNVTLAKSALPPMPMRDRQHTADVITYPSGITAQLIGVGRPASNVCWSKDGLTTQPMPSDLIHTTVVANTTIMGRMTRYFLVELSNVSPEGYVGVRAEFNPEGSFDIDYIWSRRNGKLRLNFAAELPAKDGTINMRVGVADGPWKYIATLGPAGGSSSNLSSGRGFSIQSSPVINHGDRLVKTVSHNLQEFDCRLLAVGTDGSTHSASLLTESDVGAVTQKATYDFRIPAGVTIKEYEFQTREFEWQEFRDIKLQPSGTLPGALAGTSTPNTDTTRQFPSRTLPQTSQEVTTSAAAELSGQKIERVIQDRRTGTNLFLDLDTGRLLTPPRDIIDTLNTTNTELSDKLWQSVGTEEVPRPARYIEWLRESGADLMYLGEDMVIGFDGLFAHNYPTEWQNLPPWAIGNAWAAWDFKTPPRKNQKRTFNSAQLISSGDTTAPEQERHAARLTAEQSDTWFFKTREGKMGVLELAGFSDNPRGLKIRYEFMGNTAGPSSEATSTTGARTEPATRPFFGPVIERELNSWIVPTTGPKAIDLDSGKVENVSTSPTLTVTIFNPDWVLSKGVDLAVFTYLEPEARLYYGLHAPFMVRSDRLRADQWTSMSAENFAREVNDLLVPARFRGGDADGFHSYITDNEANDLPATYAFKTRSGGTGLLQVTGFTDNPRGLKIRYKLLQTADALPTEKSDDQGTSSAYTEWASRISALNTGDWRKAFGVGQQIAKLLPEEGVAILKENWSGVTSLDARQQLLKAFASVPHERLPAVLELGLLDPSPEVQNWALLYLGSLSLQDFSKDYNAGKEWLASRCDKTVAQAFADALRQACDNLRSDDSARVLEQLRVLERNNMLFSKFPKLLEEAGFRSAMADAADTNDEQQVVEVLKTASRLSLDDEWCRQVALPLAKSTSSEVRNAAVRALGKKRREWAIDPLVAFMTEAVQKNERMDIWAAATELSDIGSAKPIPTMIGLIEADNTYDTVYGIGYFGLGKLTGVNYDAKHDGAWWRQWWQSNRQRFQAEQPAAEIPRFEPVKKKSPKSSGGGGASDVADVHAEERQAGGDTNKLYYLIGETTKTAEKNQPRPLLIVLPGGDGGRNFHPFVKRIYKNALPPNYLVAQLVAPKWDAKQGQQVVWPTAKNAYPAMKFSTEQFISAVVADIEKQHPLDAKQVFTLAWSSGGPAAYAASLDASTSVTGSFIAMSVFKPDLLPDLKAASGKAYYLLHSPEDFIPMQMPEQARDLLKQNGATVELQTYGGGHGWHGDVFNNIRTGINWLEQYVKNPASETRETTTTASTE